MPYESESPLIGGSSNNTASTADLLANGVKTTAALDSSSDVDHFRINTEGPALIKVDLSSPLLTTAKHWALVLLDGNGDILKSSTETVSGTPLVDGASQSGTTLLADGFRSAPAVGSRFVLSTTGVADTTIYTVVAATSKGGGGYELTLDKALPSNPPADNSALVFDPAQTTTGTSTSLSASVSAAGAYFVKVFVDGTVYNASDYGITATVTPTVESEGTSNNDTLANAVAANNRLVANAAVTGALSSASDVDVYVFSTASASDFTLSFGSATTSVNSEWKIEVTQADGTPLPNNTGVLAGGTAASVSIDDANFPNATTFMVKVSATSSTVFSTGSYTLKVAGTDLNLNDSPVITVGSVSGAVPNALVNSNVTRVVAAGNTTGASLTSMFTAADPDAGQSVAFYRVALTQATGTSTDAAIRVGTEGAYNYYGFGSSDQSAASVLLTPAQLATAVFLPRASTAGSSFSLYAQAFDSTSTVNNLGGTDQSGASSVLVQTISVVSAGFGVSLSQTDTKLTLSESSLGEGTSKPNATTFTMSLTQAPTSDVKVYLVDPNNQIDTKVNGTSAAVLTFTSANYGTAQTVTVTPTNDGKSEGSSQSAPLEFLVVSNDSTYDGFAVPKLSFSISDNAAPVLSAPTAVTYTDTSGADAFTTPASGSLSGTLSGSDANGETLTFGILGGTDAASGAQVVATNDLGTLTVTKASGAFVFAPAAAGLNAASSSQEATFTLTASDGSTSGTALFTVKVTGANDLPGATWAAAALVEAGGAANATTGTASAAAAATLTDAEGHAVTIDAAALVAAGWTLSSADGTYSKTGTYGTVTLTPSTGAVVYQLNDADADTQGLAAEQTVKDTLAVALADELGAKTTANFEASITGANDAPSLLTALNDVQTRAGARFSFNAASAFSDVDKTDALTYSATLEDGSALPSFMTFNATTGAFAGRSQSADVGQYAVVVTATDSAGASVSDTFQISVAASEGVDLSLTAYHWKSHAVIEGVSVTHAGDDEPTLSDVNGLVDYGAIPDLEASLTVSRDIVQSEKAAVNEAVDLQDAIGILKMIVQLDVNGANRPLSAYQSFAADFDGNGEVDLNDAIAVLKHIVGLPAPEPEWVFFHDGDPSIPGKAGTAPGAVPETLNMAAGTGLGLVAVLRGDVDGTWQPPATAAKITDDNPDYFTSLLDKVNTEAGSTVLSLSQFGIYPIA